MASPDAPLKASTIMATSDALPLESIAAGVPVVETKKEPNDLDKQEERDMDARERSAKIGALVESNRDRRANRVLRFRYAKSVYQYLCFYTVGCCAILVLSGFKVLGFALPDVVLTTITGSTAVSAIGLVGFVVSGLFKSA